MSGALAAVITYALLLVLWTIILALYVRHRRHAEGDSLIALLLTVLALDAFKSAFESAYFGTVWAANYGVLPASFKTLGEPWPLASVKLLNVAVASIVLFRLARFWVPQELQRREQQRIDLQANLKLARGNEETLRLAVSATSNFLWDTDLRTGRVTASGETWRWLGYPPEEWPPEPWDQIVHPEDAQRVAEAITAAIKGRTPNYDVKHRVRKKDGTAIQVHSTGVVARDAQGRPVRFVGSVRDVSREVEEEAARVQTQKLEGLGLLAGGIAHDFNNLLTVVTSSLELARSNTAADKKSEALDTATLAVTRATVLTRQLLAYAGRASTEHVPLDLNELVGSMGDLLSVTVPRKVTVQRELEKTLPAVMGDPAQLQQVVMNLITNAGEAIGEKEGQVTLRTAAMTLDAPPPHLRTGTISGKVVRLTVTDTGHGMSSETQARIFDPFFSTKGTGRGLGLSALAGILKSHGGAICLDSAIGRGSTFTIYLPALDKPLEKPAAPPAAEREPLSLRVLLVDDEPLLRRSTRRLLELLGCTVEEAETGRQALERVRAHVTDFDVVLMDVTMPEMSGIEASEVLRELAPKLPVVLSTGYSAGGDLPDSSSDSGLFTLAKPYTLEQMERVLRKAANAK